MTKPIHELAHTLLAEVVFAATDVQVSTDAAQIKRSRKLMNESASAVEELCYWAGLAGTNAAAALERAAAELRPTNPELAADLVGKAWQLVIMLRRSDPRFPARPPAREDQPDGEDWLFQPDGGLIRRASRAEPEPPKPTPLDGPGRFRRLPDGTLEPLE